MKAILHNRRYLLLLLIFASVLVSVVATLALVAAQVPDTHHTLGARLGSAYIDGEENIVVRVNGYPITQAEFAAERVRYRNLLWGINDLAERAIPDDEYAAESSGDHFRGPLYRGPLPQYIADGHKPRLTLLEKYGQDRVVLAELILEYARFSKAVDAGHMPSQAEVAEFVDQMRAAHESHFATSVHSEWGDAAATQGVIEAVGAQRYWSEIHTARTTRNLADSSWYQAAFQTAAENYNRYNNSGINFHEAVNSELDRKAIADVEVEIVDADEVKATPEEAIAYLHELWELQDPSPEPTAEPLVVQNLQASETHDSVTLIWDAEPSPDVLGFEILRDTNNGVFQTIAELEPSARRYVDTEGLKPNTGYYYAIRAIPNNAIEEAQIKIYTLPAP